MRGIGLREAVLYSLQLRLVSPLASARFVSPAPTLLASSPALVRPGLDLDLDRMQILAPTQALS